MLFDLRGRRRRVIQVIYAGLAVLMGGGLVLFGIGGDVSGGLLDGLGVGGSGGSRTDYQEQAERLETRIAEDPENTLAMRELARTRYLAAQAATEGGGQSGEPVVQTEESLAQYREATTAWERYVDAVENPNSDLAQLMARAYAVLNDAKGAAAAQEIFTMAQPGVATYFELARYQYFADQTKKADKNAKLAIEAAEKESEGAGEDLQKQFDEIKDAAKQYVEAQEAGTADTGESPFSGGGLSGGGQLAP